MYRRIVLAVYPGSLAASVLPIVAERDQVGRSFMTGREEASGEQG